MDRRTSTPAQRAGDKAEDLVAAWLTSAGWVVMARNVRVGRSELDIVAVDPGPPQALVVVEVRWRNRRDFGLAEETLDHRKRSALRRAVGGLLEAGALPDGTPLPHLPLRLDLVAVDRAPSGEVAIRHHRAVRP
jgi:putative endonuclease